MGEAGTWRPGGGWCNPAVRCADCRGSTAPRRRVLLRVRLLLPDRRDFRSERCIRQKVRAADARLRLGKGGAGAIVRSAPPGFDDGLDRWRSGMSSKPCAIRSLSARLARASPSTRGQTDHGRWPAARKRFPTPTKPSGKPFDSCAHSSLNDKGAARSPCGVWLRDQAEAGEITARSERKAVPNGAAWATGKVGSRSQEAAPTRGIPSDPSGKNSPRTVEV